MSSTRSNHEWPRHLIDRLIAWRFAVLAIVVVVTVVSWPISNQLEFDQRIESLYSENDPHLESFKRGKRLFGGDEFAIIAYRQPGLFNDQGGVNQAAAEKLVALAKKIQKVPGVEPESLQHIAKALAFPYQREQVAKLLEGVLIGADHETVSVVIRLLPEPHDEVLGQRFQEESDGSADLKVDAELQSSERSQADDQDEREAINPDAAENDLFEDKDSDEETQSTTESYSFSTRTADVPRGHTIAEIRKISAAHSPPAFVVGEPIQIHDMFRYVEEDGRVLFQVSLVLLSFVLFVLFRSLRWVLLPLLVVVLTIRWTSTLLVLTDAKLSMVSSMMNSLVTIIGVATTTHIAVRFRDKRTAGLPRDQSLKETLHELLPPIVWTCGTTAVGFGALLSSEITPVQSFGLMMTVATSLVFVVVAIFTPALMSTFRRKSDSNELKTSSAQGLADMIFGDPVPAPAEKQLTRALTGISGWTERNPITVAAGAAIILAVAFWGLFRLDFETDFSKNFRESSDLAKSLKFVESRLGGAGTWEINFAAPSELNEEYLTKVRNLAQRFRDELLVKPHETPDGKLTKVIAITDGLDLVPKSIPLLFTERKLSVSDRLAMLARLQSDFVVSLYNEKESRMRIVLRSTEQQQSDRKQELIDRVQQIARSELEPEKTSKQRPVEAAGLFVLLTFLIESLLRDQIVSFLIAAIGIASMMTIAFRSWRMGLVCMIPNLFPIALVIGTMGVLGLPINIATAMIASVSMGLTVDSSIHYLTEYRRARDAGATRHDAVTQTQAAVGRALVFANVALVAGFIVLTLSHFIPLVYFGFLVSVAMLGGLGGNLFLLPLLLTWKEGSLAGKADTNS